MCKRATNLCSEIMCKEAFPLSILLWLLLEKYCFWKRISYHPSKRKISAYTVNHPISRNQSSGNSSTCAKRGRYHVIYWSTVCKGKTTRIYINKDFDKLSAVNSTSSSYISHSPLKYRDKTSSYPSQIPRVPDWANKNTWKRSERVR